MSPLVLILFPTNLYNKVSFTLALSFTLTYGL
nr:MAG TPA: hypothetical protein [Caudoviricetes sp.]